MEDSNKTKWIVSVALLGLIIWIVSLNDQINELQQENADLRGQISEYSGSLDEANSNIEQASQHIEDAQGYAWTTYQEMGEALESLETVDVVSSPY